MGWIEPKRVRTSLQRRGRHLGYVTTIHYPSRDIDTLVEGSPYSEVVVADPNELHVALLQQYKAHWLIRCGTSYGVTDRGGDLSGEEAWHVAEFALLQHDLPGRTLVDVLKTKLDEMLTG